MIEEGVMSPLDSLRSCSEVVWNSLGDVSSRPSPSPPLTLSLSDIIEMSYQLS